MKKFNAITITSNGEARIAKYLRSNKIEFCQEYIFPDLVNSLTGEHLRFDFYIPSLNLCIEFDGIQHFEYTPEFHGIIIKRGKRRLEYQKFKDKQKNQYCRYKGIRLLRIKYTKFDKIESILDRIIGSKNLMKKTTVSKIKPIKVKKAKNKDFKIHSKPPVWSEEQKIENLKKYNTSLHE